MSHKLIELILNVFCLICICQMYKNSIFKKVNLLFIKDELQNTNRPNHILQNNISNTSRNTSTNTNIAMPTPESSTNKTLNHQ